MCRRMVTLDPKWAQVSVNGWSPLSYPPWTLLAYEDGGFLAESTTVCTDEKYSVRTERTLGLPQLDS